jgi:hypothetical protein
LMGIKQKQKASDSIKAAGGTDVMSTMALAKSWSNRKKAGERVMRIKTGLVALAATAAILASQEAKADLTLDTGNSAISGYTGPYGTVSVSLDSTKTIATITFTADNNGSQQFLFGGQGAVAVDVNGAFTYNNDASGANIGKNFSAPGTYSAPNGLSGQEDGFGNFDLTIDSFDGFGHSATTVTFSITKSSGTWSSADSVLSGVAAHIFVTQYPADFNTALQTDGKTQGALSTGYASTPEPTTLIAGALLLLPFGASTLKIVRRKKAE